MTHKITLAAAMMLMLLSGCVSTAKTVVTAPFKAAGQIVDWSTTSEEEADRNRGKALRKRDEQLAKLQRQQQKAAKQCDKGSREHCQRSELLAHEIEALMAAPTH